MPDQQGYLHLPALRRDVAQALNVKRGRHHKSALHDHAVASTGSPVTDGAIDVEPLLSPNGRSESDNRYEDCAQVGT